MIMTFFFFCNCNHSGNSWTFNWLHSYKNIKFYKYLLQIKGDIKNCHLFNFNKKFKVVIIEQKCMEILLSLTCINCSFSVNVILQDRKNVNFLHYLKNGTLFENVMLFNNRKSSYIKKLMFQFSVWCTRTGWDVYSMHSMYSRYRAGGGDRSWKYPVYTPTQPCSIQHAGGRVLCLNHAVSNMTAEWYVKTMLFPIWKRIWMFKPHCILLLF